MRQNGGVRLNPVREKGADLFWRLFESCLESAVYTRKRPKNICLHVFSTLRLLKSGFNAGTDVLRAVTKNRLNCVVAYD